MKLKISDLKNISLTSIRAVLRIFALAFVFVVYCVQLWALAFRRKKLASDLLALFSRIVRWVCGLLFLGRISL